MTDKSKRDEALTPEQHAVTREGATEPAFSGELLYNKAAGTYHCVACGERLFASDSKYDSGSGWPSFTAPGDNSAVTTQLDTSHGMRREEVKCASCDAHLGHLFPDGPAPTGARYCINSLALEFTPSEDAEE